MCKVPDILFDYHLGESDESSNLLEKPGSAASNKDLMPNNTSIM